MDATDVDLLERVARHDRAAFMTLYDRYSARVLGLLLKILRSRAEAEDALQDVMWQVWQKAGTYDERLGKPATWLLLLARSRALDRLRKEKRDVARVEAIRHEGGGDGPRDVDLTDLRPSLRSALGALPSDQRSAIVEAFYHGLTREQISQVQGVPVGTVKTRIRTGVARLRELLEVSETMSG